MHSQRAVPWEKWLPWAGVMLIQSAAAVPGRDDRGPGFALRASGPLSTDRIGRILHVVDLCRPVLREVPGLDRSVGRAAVVVRSVKLVHQRIESGEAGMFFLAIAPRFESTSIRVEHESVGTEERPWTEPAAARCLLQHAMVHSARSCTRRNAAF